jgi:outer membrane receptor for ferrienterochelin and colicins
MRKVFAAFVGLGSSLIPSLALADDVTDIEGMLEGSVVTSASKSAESSSQAPATAVTISAEELARYGVRTLDQAILFLGYGTTVGERRQPGEVGVRGVKIAPDLNSHVLVLVDGHAVNSQVSGQVYLDRGFGIPIELVDHIEIILGPGSVLYGTNAMLGVINVVTKRAKDYRGLHFGVETEIPTLYRGTVGAGAEIPLLGETAELTLQVEYSAYHEPLEIGDEYLPQDPYTGLPMRVAPGGDPSGVWGGRWDHNEAWEPAGYARLVIGRFELSAAAGETRRDHPHLQFDFDNPGMREVFSWVRLDARDGFSLTKELDLRLRLYADSDRQALLWRSSAATYCLPGQVGGCRLENRGGSEWVGSEVQLGFDWFADGRYATLIGLDGRVRKSQLLVDDIDQQTGTNPGSLSFDSRVDEALGVYAQQVLQLHDAVILNGGARLDVDSRFGSAISPRAAAVFLPWPGGSLKAIYSSAFRSPLPVEQGIANPLMIVRAETLRPEQVRGIEGVIEQRFGTHHFLTSVFRTWWTDMVVLTSLTPAELLDAQSNGDLFLFAPSGRQYRNSSSIENWGINLGYDAAVLSGRLRYGVNWTAAYARQSYQDGRPDAPLPEMPATYGNARISYDFGAPWPTVALAARYKGKQTVFNVEPGAYPYEPTVPERVVVLGNVTGPAPGIRGLSYRLGVRVASSDQAAAAIGEVRTLTPQNPTPTLAPLETFRVLAGLQYDLDL